MGLDPLAGERSWKANEVKRECISACMNVCVFNYVCNRRGCMCTRMYMCVSIACAHTCTGMHMYVHEYADTYRGVGDRIQVLWKSSKCSSLLSHLSSLSIPPFYLLSFLFHSHPTFSASGRNLGSVSVLVWTASIAI